MKSTITKPLACPSCHNAEFLRANVMQDTSVTVNDAGAIRDGYDYSLPELDDSGELYCSHCGSHLRLHHEGGNYRLILDE